MLALTEEGKLKAENMEAMLRDRLHSRTTMETGEGSRFDAGSLNQMVGGTYGQPGVSTLQAPGETQCWVVGQFEFPAP